MWRTRKGRQAQEEALRSHRNGGDDRRHPEPCDKNDHNCALDSSGQCLCVEVLKVLKVLKNLVCDCLFETIRPQHAVPGTKLQSSAGN